MLHYLRKYPVSLAVILAVIYLSFFKPPKTELDTVKGFDKLVHVLMYLGMSGMLWWEFLKAHRKRRVPLWHAWIGALVCPVLFSGLVEILQARCTTYRGGDWWDFVASSAGAVLASLIGYFVFRPMMARK